MSNRAPVASDAVFEIEAGDTLSGQLTVDDPDGDPLTFSLTQPPDSGTLVLNVNTGEFEYTAPIESPQSDTILFFGSDQSLTSNEARVVFNIQPRVPVEVARLPSVGGDTFSSFTTGSNALAIDGSTIIAGAIASDKETGAAYIFSRSAEGVWGLETVLTPAQPEANERLFGSAVAIWGDMVAVTSLTADETGTLDSGYVSVVSQR